MKYHAYELAHAWLSPMRYGTEALRFGLDVPFNPMSATPLARALSAACHVFENVTRRYAKPAFGIDLIEVDGRTVCIRQRTALAKPFCNLVAFDRDDAAPERRQKPAVLLIAPMSGHYASLLRGTVRSLLTEHDVYVTDWADARDVPVYEGQFDLSSFIDYVLGFLRFIGPRTHVVAICQSAVPALAATALMAAGDDACQPASLTLMAGPVDTRRNPTRVNALAKTRSLDWFERHVVSHVPFPHAGFMRRVYPGFMQLSGFMTMHLARHVDAHVELFNSLITGDCDTVKQHQDFYEEYLAVMDLTAEFYLDTIRTVFQEHSLARGTMRHRGVAIDCGAIEKTALITIEGERDDICGRGQTEAAQDLCPNIPSALRYHYVQPGVGHFGVFHGTRWRTETRPRLAQIMRSVEERGAVWSVRARLDGPPPTVRDELFP